ncbi:hypothetical protein AAFF_G00190370 [Aldrovandia affinis]|uniref:Uncharacterized protein n=1 Tax=Aldrovandia affinis TaxID=143900 RepID=A0AAD7RJE0_9TELE|nr:hypothetical protein AAFF_G00190370 [Aldrovandia affinis]
MELRPCGPRLEVHRQDPQPPGAPVTVHEAPTSDNDLVGDQDAVYVVHRSAPREGAPGGSMEGEQEVDPPSLTMSEAVYVWSTEAGVPRMGSHHRQEMGRSSSITLDHGDDSPQAPQVEPYIVQEFTFSSSTSSEDGR